jgi:ankyrin repeat protein
MKRLLLIAIFLIGLNAALGQNSSRSVQVSHPAKSELVGRTSDELDNALIQLTRSRSPDKASFQSLLMRGADPNTCEPVNGASVLLEAVLKMDTRSKGGPLDEQRSAAWLDIVKLLLESGANPSKPMANGFTPLMAAAAHNLKDAVQLLLQYQADPGAQDSGGRTALFFAAREGNSVTLKLLVSAGADVNAGTDYRPLHVAAECGNKEAVVFLLSRKADVNSTNRDGQTPLGVAQKLLSARLGNPTLNAYQIERLKAVIDLMLQYGGKK